MNSDQEKERVKLIQSIHKYHGNVEESDPEVATALLERMPIFRNPNAAVFDRLIINHNSDGTMESIESSKKKFEFVWTFDKKLAEIKVTMKGQDEKWK